MEMSNTFVIIRYKSNKGKIKQNTANMANTEVAQSPYSFKKGWGKLQRKDSKDVMKDIMEALELDTTVSFYRRLRGEVEPKISEHESIEKIFASYGVTDVWGNK